ncbi:hypothetical protein D3C71_538140 [compost metagenome]
MELFDIILLVLFYALGTAVAVIPSFSTIKRPKLKTLTTAGKWFVTLFILLFSVSIIKDVKSAYDDNSNEIARHKYENTIQRILKRSDSLEIIHSKIYIDSIHSMSKHIVRSDTLHSKEMTEYIRKLDGWGLEIRDSNIVRKQPGSPLIKATNLIIDTIDNYYEVSVWICNSGTAEAFNVKFDIYRLQKNNNSITKRIAAQDVLDLGIGNCYQKSLLYELPKITQNTGFFVEGTYEDKAGKKRYYSCSYNYNFHLKKWTLNTDN